MSTLTELLTKLNTEYIKIDPNNKIWSTTEKTSFINGGFLQIQKDWGFRWRENEASYTFTTVWGTIEYTLPTDFIKLDQVEYSWVALLSTDRKSVRLRNPLGSQSTPNYYYIYGTKLGFDPIPDTSISIVMDYMKRLPTITGSQSSSLPEDFDNAICAYAAYLAMNSVEKQGKAISMQADYQQNLNMLLGTYQYQDLNMSFSLWRSAPFYRDNVI